MNWQRCILAMIGAGVFATVSAEAAPFIVTSTADSGAGSLRQAISASPAGGSIEFNIPTTQPGYNSSTGVFTIALTSGELQIARNLTVTGPTNAKVWISGSNLFRIFNVITGNVIISNLTMTNGRNVGANGANATASQSATPGGSATGGGILNAGTLALQNCTIASCLAVGGSGGSGNGLTNFTGGANGGGASGGAIANAGSLSVINCTFSANGAQSGSGGIGTTNTPAGNGGAADGGAIQNAGSLTLVNTTVSGNLAIGFNGGSGTMSAPPGAGGAATGGGLSRFGAGTAIVLQNTIVAANSASPGSGGSNPNVMPSIGPTGASVGPDVNGAVVSQGHNLIGRSDGSSGWIGTDLLGGTTNGTRLDPLLGSLQDNSGPTYTRRPMTSSAAIDNGDDAGLSAPLNLTTDQRGYPRKIGTHVDIGAVEVGPVQPGPTLTVTNTASHDDSSCTTEDCTFIEALNASNANANANTIIFAPSVSGTISSLGFNANAGFGLTNPVTINGPGARVLTISGESAARVFQVTSANVVINGLSMSFGLVNQGSGGAITNSGGLTLQDCLIYFSGVTGNDPVGSGGGIYNGSGATLTLNRCSLLNNGSTSYGGAVYSDGVFNATNCTFSNNAGLRGGGIIVRAAAPGITLRNCTITANTATDGVATPGFGGGGVYAEGGAQQHFMANCIVSGNTSVNDPDVRGNYTTQGHNLITSKGDSAGFTNGVSGDIIGLAANFDTLENNGGPTDTWSLLNTSPAINNGDNTLAPPTDQRGYLRNNLSDIGAFEFNGAVPVLKIISITRAASGHIIVQATGIPNSAHTVNVADDPDSGSFGFGGTVTSNASGLLSFDDAGAVGLTKRFYRLAFP